MEPEEDSVATDGLLDRVMRREGRGGPVAMILIVVGICGLLLGGVGLVSIAGQPWGLDARSPVTTSLDSECGRFTGATYTIEVAGVRQVCRGGDSKCGSGGPVAVAYDPADPSRCRVAANIGRLSRYETRMVWIGCMFALLLLAGAAYRRSEALRIADLVEGTATHRRGRARLRAISTVALIAAIVASNVSVILPWLGVRP